MASPEILLREQAIALSEAIQIIKGLLGEDSPRLYSAQHDVVGRGMPEYVSSMVIFELTKVVAAQQERIEALEAKQKVKAKS
jgi:hypothetical protein